MSYDLYGRLLEVCTCNILCPCWVGEDPDLGYCDGVLAWQVDKGTVDGVDVSGHSLIILAHIPGNILKGNWRAVVYVDDGASPEQKDALLKVWTGKLGGPVADLAKLVGEITAVEQLPVTFTVEGVDGTLKIGSAVEAYLQPYTGATGQSTTMRDTIFTTIPGSPAYVGKASLYHVEAPQHGFKIHLKDHNAVQGEFHFQA